MHRGCPVRNVTTNLLPRSTNSVSVHHTYNWKIISSEYAFCSIYSLFMKEHGFKISEVWKN